MIKVILSILVVAMTVGISISLAFGGTIKNKLDYEQEKIFEIGIVLPASPNTAYQYLRKMKNYKIINFEGLTFYTGKLYGINTVISVPPAVGGLTYTGIDCFVLEKKFKPKLLIDPGTAGSHLYDLTVGDVVIGARVVNFGNYITTRTGRIIPGADNLLVGDKEGYKGKEPDTEYLYSNPILVNLTYKVAKNLKLYTPKGILKAKEGRKAWIVRDGTQGSSDTWLRDPELIRASSKIFGEIDEAGDWPIALISCDDKIPFIEIHTIANAALDFPTKINSYFHDCSLYAQKRSNSIAIALIKKIAKRKNIKLDDYNCANRFNEAGYQYKINTPGFVKKWTAYNR